MKKDFVRRWTQIFHKGRGAVWDSGSWERFLAIVGALEGALSGTQLSGASKIKEKALREEGQHSMRCVILKRHIEKTGDLEPGKAEQILGGNNGAVQSQRIKSCG